MMNGLANGVPKGWNDPPTNLSSSSSGQRQRPKLLNQRVAFPVGSTVTAGGHNPVSMGCFPAGPAGQALMSAPQLQRVSFSSPELCSPSVGQPFQSGSAAVGAANPQHLHYVPSQPNFTSHAAAGVQSPLIAAQPQQYPQQFPLADQGHVHRNFMDTQPQPQQKSAADVIRTADNFYSQQQFSAFSQQHQYNPQLAWQTGAAPAGVTFTGSSSIAVAEQRTEAQAPVPSTLSANGIMEFLTATLHSCTTLQAVERGIIAERLEILRSSLQTNLLAPQCFSQLSYLVEVWRSGQLSLALQAQAALSAFASENDRQWLAGLQLLISECATNS